MTVLRLTSKAGPDGIVKFDAGVPGADVDIVASVRPTLTDEQWRKEVGEILDSMAGIHVERYPRRPMRDRWSQA